MDRQSIYKGYKNKLNHSLRIAKRLYYEKKLNNVQSNARAAWKVLNEILNKSRRNSNRCSTFKDDDREITDPVEIANTFCSNNGHLSLRNEISCGFPLRVLSSNLYFLTVH